MATLDARIRLRFKIFIIRKDFTINNNHMGTVFNRYDCDFCGDFHKEDTLC